MSKQKALPKHAAADQGTLDVTVIKQFPGKETAERRVKVKAPGKFFTNLEASEQKVDYWGEAVEFRERYHFPRHAKVWKPPPLPPPPPPPLSPPPLSAYPLFCWALFCWSWACVHVDAICR